MSILKFRDEYGNIIEMVAIRGPAGPAGPQGEKGDPGTGVTILGSYDTEAQLNAAHPTGNPGDSYLVAGYLYVWAESEGKWKNVGQIQGPAGPAGPAGATGATGSPGAKGDTGNGISSITLNNDYTLTIRYTNGSSTTTGSVRGAQGPKGDSGEQGPPGSTGAPGVGIDYIDITSDYKLKVRYTNGSEAVFSRSLLGPAGPQGEQGEPGQPGEPGYTPVRGADYWTSSDIAEIKSYCDQIVAGYNPIAVLSGSAAPTADIGNDGDIYLVTG